MARNKKKYYLVGIKGVGMTMLAQFLAASGCLVEGSDTAETFLTDPVLKKAGIKVKSPFSPQNIPFDADYIIYSTAYNPADNTELAYIENNSKLRKIVRPYAQALGELFNQQRGLAVCGSHGKTTVSAWLGYVLYRAGKDPNVLVGSRVPQLGGSSRQGRSRYFIAETDEYQNKLRYFQPWGAILTNIEFDHPDYFRNQAAYTKVFRDFVKKIPPAGFLVYSASDHETKKILGVVRGRKISCSLLVEDRPDYLASRIRSRAGGQGFDVSCRGRSLGRFRISLIGEHNVQNALTVIATARQLGVKLSDLRRALASFRGTARRLENLGRYHGATILDDYAHHPTEVKATLSGVRKHYQKERIITVFHPHTFTRTKALFPDFVSSFLDTDELIILDIYGSAREKQGGVSSAQLVAAIRRANEAAKRKQAVRRIATIGEAVRYLEKHLHRGDLLLLMGAGDVFRVAEKLLDQKRN